jgi:hypothetical protein
MLLCGQLFSKDTFERYFGTVSEFGQEDGDFFFLQLCSVMVF